MGWVERNQAHPNYARLSYVFREHHRRFVAYVKREGVPCQDCKGHGGYKEVVCDDGTGPWYECGWCFGTCLTTRWLKGQWLRMKREEKRERLARRKVAA